MDDLRAEGDLDEFSGLAHEEGDRGGVGFGAVGGFFALGIVLAALELFIWSVGAFQGCLGAFISVLE